LTSALALLRGSLNIGDTFLLVEKEIEDEFSGLGY